MEVAEKAKAKYVYATADRFCRRALDLAEKHEGLTEERMRARVLLGDLSSLSNDLSSGGTGTTRFVRADDAPAVAG